MAQQVLITMSKGVVTGVSSDGELEVTIVNYDRLEEGAVIPALPVGVAQDAEGDLTFTPGWSDLVWQ